MKFNIIVVLCAGNFITPEDYNDYIKINNTNVYLGAINRMNAAVMMEHTTESYIVVGGEQRKSARDETIHDKQISKKTDYGSSIWTINQWKYVCT